MENKSQISYIHSQIFIFSLAAIAFILPIYKMGPSIPTILLIGNWFFEGHFAKKWQRAKNIMSLGFIGFFLITFTGLFFSDNINDALFNVQLKLSLLFIPLVVLTSQHLTYNNLQIVITSFIIGCLVCASIGISYGIFNWWESGELHHIYYKYMLSFTNMHTSYLAMFVTFAIFILLENLINQVQLIKIKPIFKGFILLLFTLFVFLLASKGQIIVFFILVNFYVIYVFWKKAYLAIIVVLLVNGLMIGGLYSLDLPQKRFEVLLQSIYNGEENGVKTGRFRIWAASWDAIKQSPFIGYGHGDVDYVLKEEYKKRGFAEGEKRSFNAHNQFLQTWLASGLPGLAFLFLIIFWSIYIAYRKGDILLFLLGTLLLLSFMAESMLESQSGVVFSGLMLSLFYKFSDCRLTFSTYNGE